MPCVAYGPVPYFSVIDTRSFSCRRSRVDQRRGCCAPGEGCRRCEKDSAVYFAFAHNALLRREKRAAIPLERQPTARKGAE